MILKLNTPTTHHQIENNTSSNPLVIGEEGLNVPRKQATIFTAPPVPPQVFDGPMAGGEKTRLPKEFQETAKPLRHGSTAQLAGDAVILWYLGRLRPDMTCVFCHTHRVPPRPLCDFSPRGALNSCESVGVEGVYLTLILPNFVTARSTVWIVGSVAPWN